MFLNFDLAKAWDYENGFYLTSHKTRLSKLLAHYELYKMITGLPGFILECGVYKGASLIRFATFRDVLESQYSRKIIGFDAFGKFPRSGDSDDINFIEKFEDYGGDGISKEELEKVLVQKEIINYELIEGNILQKVPLYVKQHPELRIALLHIDVDVYEPTKVILQHLYDRVVSNGIIVLDDYATVAGETLAVEEFFRNTKIEKLSISHIPSFIKKQ